MALIARSCPQTRPVQASSCCGRAGLSAVAVAAVSGRSRGWMEGERHACSGEVSAFADCVRLAPEVSAPIRTEGEKRDPDHGRSRSQSCRSRHLYTRSRNPGAAERSRRSPVSQTGDSPDLATTAREARTTEGVGVMCITKCHTIAVPDTRSKCQGRAVCSTRPVNSEFRILRNLETERAIEWRRCQWNRGGVCPVRRPRRLSVWRAVGPGLRLVVRERPGRLPVGREIRNSGVEQSAGMSQGGPGPPASGSRTPLKGRPDSDATTGNRQGSCKPSRCWPDTAGGCCPAGNTAHAQRERGGHERVGTAGAGRIPGRAGRAIGASGPAGGRGGVRAGRYDGSGFGTAWRTCCTSCVSWSTWRVRVSAC